MAENRTFGAEKPMRPQGFQNPRLCRNIVVVVVWFSIKEVRISQREIKRTERKSVNYTLRRIVES